MPIVLFSSGGVERLEGSKHKLLLPQYLLRAGRFPSVYQ